MANHNLCSTLGFASQICTNICWLAGFRKEPIHKCWPPESVRFSEQLQIFIYSVRRDFEGVRIIYSHVFERYNTRAPRPFLVFLCFLTAKSQTLRKCVLHNTSKLGGTKVLAASEFPTFSPALRPRHKLKEQWLPTEKSGRCNLMFSFHQNTILLKQLKLYTGPIQKTMQRRRSL